MNLDWLETGKLAPPTEAEYLHIAAVGRLASALHAVLGDMPLATVILLADGDEEAVSSLSRKQQKRYRADHERVRRQMTAKAEQARKIVEEYVALVEPK